MEYTELKGSEKQIAWANSIREKFVEYQVKTHGEIETMKPRRQSAVRYMVEKIDSASWWINNLHGSYELCLRTAVEQFNIK